MDKPFYSGQEAAKLCGVTRMTISRWIASGKMKAQKVGRTLVIPLSEIAKCKRGIPKGGQNETRPSTKKAAEVDAYSDLPEDIRLRLLVRPILKSHGIVRAGLFGSAARGEMNDNSDVDILVDTAGKMNLFEIVGLKQEIEQKLHRSVDLLEYGAIKPALRARIMQNYLTIV